MTEIEWCCNGFKAQFDNHAERGLFVALERITESSSKEFRFVIGARMIDPDKSDAFADAVKSLAGIPEHITLDCSTGMRFCPWCGCDLRKQYGKHAQTMLKNQRE